MVKKISIIVSGVSLLLSGCLTNTQVNNDLMEMKRRLEAVEQVTVAKRGPDTDERFVEQGRRLADLRAEFDALRVEFQRLNGRLDDSSSDTIQINDKLARIQSDLDLRLTGLDTRLSALEQGGSAVQVVAPATGGGEASYEKGLALIQQEKRYSDGRKELQAFLKAKPKHELAVNAMYWIGEAYYGEKQYEKAILQFQDVLKDHPNHNKASAALYKQAITFEAFGEKGMAKSLFEKLVKNYPDSPEAPKAKERLK